MPLPLLLLAAGGLPACHDTKPPAALPDPAGDAAPGPADAGEKGADAGDAGPLDLGPGGDGSGEGGLDGAAAAVDAADAADADDAGALPPDACIPAAETCNGADDDCDGETDEDLGLGPCSSVCGQGKLRCLDGEVFCDAPQPGPEICDGADNDCNGAVDDGLGACCWPPDSTRPCGSDVGRCAPGVQTCAGADGWGPCVGALGPADELCNGEDDDCNGVVDDVAEEGQPCGSAVGECRPGSYHCANGLELCLGERGPAAEVCDGLDNDCDGTADQGNPGGGGSCGSSVGLCRPGVLGCEQGLLRCLGGVAPAPERCNGEDDDCDGETDEGELVDLGLPCETGEPGRCAAGATGCMEGNRVCLRLHEPLPAELCNEEDDDCNGRVDEGLGKGDPCWAGLGACRRPGERVCAADGQGTVCSAAAGAPGVELCGTGVDEDCDGEVDEGFPLGEPCSAGVGACRRTGELVCTADGSWVACNAVPGGPGPEQCGTGVDEDCDGEVDEGFTVGLRCEVGIGGCRRAGMLVCSPDRLDVVCDAVPGQPGEELCGTGADEDCDGEVDEGFALGLPCTSGVGGCLQEGKTVCSADGRGVECSAVPGLPAEELCGTGVDEDCDGEVDEGFALGLPCTSGVGECRREGVTVCSLDRRSATCGALPGQPEPELCDGLDNDCDGQVDEEPGCGEECGPGFIDAACRDPDRFCVAWPTDGRHHCSDVCDHQGECPAGFACTVDFPGFTSGFGLCLPPAAQASKGLGEACQADEECLSNACIEQSCRQLCSSEGWRDPAHDFCPAGEVCALYPTARGGYAGFCVPPVGRAIGVACNMGSQCQTGFCDAGNSGECRPTCQTHYD